MTPLYFASWKGHIAVVQLLLQMFASASICKKVRMTLNYILHSLCCTIQLVNVNGLHILFKILHDYSNVHLCENCGSIIYIYIRI